MEEKIKKYLGYLPYLVPIVYFLGFILINGYLSNFGYSDYSILSISYLKTGILISVLFSILFLNCWFSFDEETMSDNYEKSWKSLLTILHNLLAITLLIDIYLIGVGSFGKIWAIIVFSFFFTLYLLFRLWADNKLPKNNFGFLILVVPGIVLLIIVNLIFAFNNTLAYYLLIFNVVVTVFMTLSLGLYGDKNYKSRIIGDFIFLIIFCFVFGNKIYGHLPNKIGGGQPYKIVIDNNCLLNDSISKLDTLNVIYENEDKFIFRRDSSVFVVSRDEIKCYYLIK